MIKRTRAVRFALSFVLALGFGASAGAITVRDHRDPSLGGGAYSLSVPSVFEMKLTRSAGRTTTCETRNVQGRTDPVLHILNGADPVGNVTEIARDDDSAGNLNARVSFRAPSTGTYLLVMRATWKGRTGTADLYCDGNPVAFKISVGGAFKRLENLRSGETISIVPLAGGSSVATLYALDEQGRMIKRQTSGGNQTASYTAANTPVELAMAGSLWPDPVGDIRLIRNDNRLSNHDKDGDGLGDELEAAIGTCSSRTGAAGNWECSRVADARDTDGDGLTDAAELIGIVDASPYQLLPRWGADPRHKDIFVEVDFMVKAPNETPRRMSPEAAMQMAAIYADPETDAVLRLLHAQQLNNTDLEPGIRLHFDTGQPPPQGASKQELETYGDWGGYGVAAPVKTNNGWRGADAADVWQNMMDTKRRGVFHFALGYTGDGGQAPTHTFTANLPLDNAATAAHEFGHTLGLLHSGPEGIGDDANCKPNYPSVMSYAYLNMQGFVSTFSDGFGRPALNNVNLKEKGAISEPASAAGKRYLAHLRDVFKFPLVEATGDVDWNRDGVISATPLRAYANNNHSGCELTRVNAVKAAGLSNGALSLTRFQGRTFVIYIDERDGKLHSEHTDHTLKCTIIGQACGAPLTHTLIPGNWNSGIEAFDAHPVAEGLLIVFRKGSGLFETILTKSIQATLPAPISAAPATGELSLAGDGARAWLAFKSNLGEVVIKERTPSGPWSAVWSDDQAARNPSGVSIGLLAANGSPAILSAPYADGTRHLLGAFPSAPNGNIQLMERDSTTGRWSMLPFTSESEPTTGRPALAFEPVSSASPMPGGGRLRLMYLRASSANNFIVKTRALEASQLGSSAELEMVQEDHDNVWFYGRGVDLLYEPGVDSNLRAAIATALVEKDVPQPHVIELRPNADGIVNFLQRNWADWETLAIDTCRTLKKGGASVNCHDWPFKPPTNTTGPEAPLTSAAPPIPGAVAPVAVKDRARCLQRCNAGFDQCIASGQKRRSCQTSAESCAIKCQ